MSDNITMSITSEAIKWAVSIILTGGGLYYAGAAFRRTLKRDAKERLDKKADKETVKLQIDLILKDIDSMKKEINEFKESNFQSHVDIRGKVDENFDINKDQHKELKDDLKEHVKLMSEMICQHLNTLSEDLRYLKTKVA